MTPIPMLLWCPGCGGRHIDEGAFATRPHHTHACQSCGLVWRPCILNTVGVQYLPGFKNEVASDNGEVRMLERRAAHEMRILRRSADPLAAATYKLAQLRGALIAANDQGSESMCRIHGGMLCDVCGDPARDHPVCEDEPYLNHLCTGERVKL